LAHLDVEALEAYMAYENCYLKSETEEDYEQPSSTEEQENPCDFSNDKDFPSSPA